MGLLPIQTLAGIARSIRYKKNSHVSLCATCSSRDIQYSPQLITVGQHSSSIVGSFSASTRMPRSTN